MGPPRTVASLAKFFLLGEPRQRPAGAADPAPRGRIGWTPFVEEVDLPHQEPAAVVQRFLVPAGHRLWLWDLDGAPVSMAAALGPTPSGIRIRAVYTPPEHRGHGFVSNLVAALSQAELDAGRRECYRYTDLENATSYHIYASLGYEPCGRCGPPPVRALSAAHGFAGSHGDRVEVLILGGPAGVGKSSVAFEASLILERASVAHALVDTDGLDHIRPVPDDLPHLTEENLRAVWDAFSRRGCHRLLLAGVWLHRPSERAWVECAVPGSRITAVRLAAAEATIEAYIRRREVGSGREDQLVRSLRQAREMASGGNDAIEVVTDGLDVTTIATRVLELWARSA